MCLLMYGTKCYIVCPVTLMCDMRRYLWMWFVLICYWNTQYVPLESSEISDICMPRLDRVAMLMATSFSFVADELIGFAMNSGYNQGASVNRAALSAGILLGSKKTTGCFFFRCGTAASAPSAICWCDQQRLEKTPCRPMACGRHCCVVREPVTGKGPW